MKIPQFEDSINTVQDLLDNNITIFEYDYLFHSYKNWYFAFALNNPDWNHLAETMVPANTSCWKGPEICADVNGTWAYYIKHHLHGKKTHAFIYASLDPYDLKVMPDKKNWWRSAKLREGAYS